MYRDRTLPTDGNGLTVGEEFNSNNPRKDFAMKNSKKVWRLCDLLERRIMGARYYEYAQFCVYHDAFSQDIDEEGFNEALNELAYAIYGQGSRWFEITDDLYDENGKFCIDIDGNDCFEIQDITDMIPIFSKHTRFYILVNGLRTEYQWVIAVPQD